MTIRVVAVHGNGGGSTRFARLAPYLPADIELDAVDLPGFGGTPPDATLDSVEGYADRLGSMLGDDRPIVLGHGIGGSIALDLASRRPELLRGLILHAPVAADLDRRLFPRLMSTALVRELARRLIASRLLRPLWRRAFFPTGAPTADLDVFFDGYRNCASFGQMFEIIDADWFERVTPIRELPCVLLWGEHDRVLDSAQVDAVTAKVPNGRVVIAAGWDHFPMLEQPEDYSATLADLARELAG